MRLVSLTLIALFAVAAHARFKAPILRKPTSINKTDERIRLLSKYFDCFSKNDSEQLSKIKSCVSAVVNPALPQSEKDRLVSWPLLNEIELDQFVDCPGKILAQRRSFTLSTGLAVCASGQVNGKKEVITFYFDSDSSKLKLHALFY